MTALRQALVGLVGMFLLGGGWILMLFVFGGR